MYGTVGGEGVEDFFFLDGVSNFFEGKRGDGKNFLRQEEDANFLDAID